ncbi:hypothetical protein ACI3KS_06945, partial [Microbacterium sp. ZW T5_45]|uniref:hypothetical protein n=1 Tax=Microbacterium sp. ZW T5_45 TaxID=3378080 RepID=UPI0038538D43
MTAEAGGVQLRGVRGAAATDESLFEEHPSTLTMALSAWVKNAVMGMDLVRSGRCARIVALHENRSTARDHEVFIWGGPRVVELVPVPFVSGRVRGGLCGEPGQGLGGCRVAEALVP